MANINNSSGGSVSGSVTAEISATTSNGTVVTGDTTGVVAIPAGALWVRVKCAGVVVSGDTVGPATIEGATWYPGREELWAAVWNTNNNDYIKLPEINIDGNGARVYYSYFS